MSFGFRRFWSLLTLILVGLNMGAAFAHVLELPGKMRLDGPSYLLVQSIYRGFGPVGAFLEPGSVLAAAIMTWQMRGRRAAFGWSLAGFACLAAALAAWLALVSPMNERMDTGTATSIPDDWTATRDQWEYTHAARFVLQLAGFVALLRAALSDSAVACEAALPEAHAMEMPKAA